MNGLTWGTCRDCGSYFKPGRGEEPVCDCGYELQEEDMDKE